MEMIVIVCLKCITIIVGLSGISGACVTISGKYIYQAIEKKNDSAFSTFTVMMTFLLPVLLRDCMLICFCQCISCSRLVFCDSASFHRYSSCCH